MHLKLVVNSFPKFSETFLFNLVTGLEKKGIKVTVFATQKNNDRVLYTHELKDWSGNIQYVLLRPLSISNILNMMILVMKNPLFFSRTIREMGIKKGIFKFINTLSLLKGDPDIVHFSYSGLAITYLDCLSQLHKLSVKTVVSCRGSAEKVKPLLDPERAEKLKLLFSRINLVHFVSKDMMYGLSSLGLTTSKSFVNYPSVNLSLYKKNISVLNDPQGIINIVTTGRLTFAKGYIFALQAMKILRERGFKFRYHIVGEGPDRAMITFAIHALGLTNEVIVHGKVSSLEVIQYLNKADIFLLSSVYEGIANAALEAMAMEVPLVTTKAGGMSEVVQHKQNGMIVDCFNGSELANAIEEVIASPELRSLITKNARATVEKKFSLNNQIDIFMAQYQSLLPVTGNAV